MPSSDSVEQSEAGQEGRCEPRIAYPILRARDALEAAIVGLSTEQLQWSLPGKWSAAQILEHLAITFGTTADLMKKIADRRHTRSAQPSARQWFIAWVVTGLGYMPEGRKSPAFAVPKGAPTDQVLQQLRVNLLAMDAALTDVERCFGAGVAVADHPILGPLTVRQWRRFHFVHTRHHVKQLHRLRRLQGVAAAASGASA